MASNAYMSDQSHLNYSDHVFDDFQPEQNPKRRRLSWTSQPNLSSLTMSDLPSKDPHTALLQGHDHEGAGGRSRHLAETAASEKEREKEDGFLSHNASKQAEKMITPFLAQHIPQQYNPMGANSKSKNKKDGVNTKYCYRHRPDLLCRRQADEPSMEQLQEELGSLSQADQQGIAHAWSLFSAAPSKHRNLMLQGILAQCCFPQLSFISSSVRNLIKIDFLAALPPELGFKILCYLDTTSLCKAAQVSRRWRTLADDDVVWHKMCEQHIDRKCTKCGWGLPLLEQKRLRTEKRQIQLRATGRGLNEWSPNITPIPESHLNQIPATEDTLAGAKRRASDEDFATSAKRCRTEFEKGDGYFDRPVATRPWKDVYKDRFKVGTNWKYGRYCTKVFRGHTNGVMCLQFEDNLLMTGSYDGTVKLWDMETGDEIRTLTGHTAGIRCLQFDDSRLFTGSLDRTIKVWNWRSGECVSTLTGHSKGVLGLHWTDNILVSGSMDNTIRVWDYTHQKRFTLRGHTDWVNCVKIDGSSRTLFSASDDCTIKLWDLDTHACIKTFEGHAGQVQQVLPLPSEFEIDEDEFVRDLPHDASDTASQSSSSHHHRRRPSHPQPTEPRCSSPSAPTDPFFPDDPARPQPPTYMLTGSLDGTIRLWHVPSSRCIHRFFGHVEGIWALAADTLRMVSGAEDKTVKVWDPRTGRCERTLTGHTAPVTTVGLSDSRLVSGGEDGEVRCLTFQVE